MTNKLELYGVFAQGETARRLYENGNRVIDADRVREFINYGLSDESDTIYIDMAGPGGDVDVMATCLSLLKSTGKKTEGHIHGFAASAMTLFACQLDSVAISNPGRYMIHNPKGTTTADAEGMEKDAKHLRALNETYADMYAKKTGKSQKEMLKLMQAETWLTAEQALELGFVDSIIESKMNIAAYADDYAIQLLSQFSTTPDELKKDTSMKNIIAAVGLKSDADEAAVIAKFDSLKSTIDEKSSLITSLTEKVTAKDTEVNAVKAELQSLQGKLVQYRTGEVLAKLQKETGHVIGAEGIEALNRRVERYLSMEEGAAETADAYEDMKAFCIAKGVKAGTEFEQESGRQHADAESAVIARAEAIQNEKKITFKDAYMIAIKEVK